MIPGMPTMREAGTKHAASMPSSSTSPMGRSPPVSPRSMQRGHAHHGPGMAGDKRMTSPKGSKMMRMSSGSDARGGKTKKHYTFTLSTQLIKPNGPCLCVS